MVTASRVHSPSSECDVLPEPRAEQSVLKNRGDVGYLKEGFLRYKARAPEKETIEVSSGHIKIKYCSSLAAVTSGLMAGVMAEGTEVNGKLYGQHKMEDIKSNAQRTKKLTM